LACDFFSETKAAENAALQVPSLGATARFVYHDSMKRWPPLVVRRPFLQTLLAGALLAILGCALGDYEAKIDEQQKRVELFDTEIRSLSSDWIDKPLYQPNDPKEGKQPYWPFDVFLRLPSGSGRGNKGVYQDNGRGPYLARFAWGSKTSVFVAAGLLPTEGKTKDEKGKPLPFVWTTEEFREHVRGALIDYYRKELTSDPQFSSLDPKLFAEIKKEPLGTKGPPIAYDAVSLTDFKRRSEDTAFFEMYFNQQSNRQAAIIYQFPESKRADDATRKAVEWSLRSFDVNPNSISSKRDLLNRRKAAARR
jgi:hypothetical protein